MDKFLRFFIIFHGYCIAIASFVLTVIFTIEFAGWCCHARWEDLAFLHYTGIPALVFGVLWMLANISLLHGIIKEKKQFIYPFCAAFSIDLFLLVIKDLSLLITNGDLNDTVFFNILPLPLFLFTIPYVILTMLALIRLFDIDPIIRTREEDFVRFDRGPNHEENAEKVTISA